MNLHLLHLINVLRPSYLSATRGLDSSTALEFVQILRAATDINRLTSIVSLYQAGERLYELFDKVRLFFFFVREGTNDFDCPFVPLGMRSLRGPDGLLRPRQSSSGLLH